MKDLALFVAKRLVDKPDAVSIAEIKDGDVTVFKIECDENDKGKLIGKQGKVIKAIRALVSVPGQKAGLRTDVDID